MTIFYNTIGMLVMVFSVYVLQNNGIADATYVLLLAIFFSIQALFWKDR